MKYRWKANTNNEVFYQDEILYGDLDFDNIKVFSLVDQNLRTKYSINKNKEDKVVYRKRVKIRMGQGQEACHLVLHFTPNGNKFAFIWDETGDIQIRDNFKQNHPWFYAPEYMENEINGYE